MEFCQSVPPKQTIYIHKDKERMCVSTVYSFSDAELPAWPTDFCRHNGEFSHEPAEKHTITSCTGDCFQFHLIQNLEREEKEMKETKIKRIGGRKKTILAAH